jgi:hypothetical protein
MHWIALATVFLTGMVKFLLAPALGLALGLSYIETYFFSLGGAVLSMFIFYYSADYLLRRSHQKKLQKIKKENNHSFQHQKVFTKKNKFIVKMKKSIGIVPFAFWVPFFFSIPVGSIVVAKFYGKRKITFPLMVIGQVINNIANVGIVYFLNYEASVIL